jgi:hypothetical protein
MVRVDGNVSTLERKEGQEPGWIPPDACAQLDCDATT